MRYEDYKFEARLYYTIRPCLKREGWRQGERREEDIRDGGRRRKSGRLELQED